MEGWPPTNQKRSRRGKLVAKPPQSITLIAVRDDMIFGAQKSPWTGTPGELSFGMLRCKNSSSAANSPSAASSGSNASDRRSTSPLIERAMGTGTKPLKRLSQTAAFSKISGTTGVLRSVGIVGRSTVPRTPLWTRHASRSPSSHAITVGMHSSSDQGAKYRRASYSRRRLALPRPSIAVFATQIGAVWWLVKAHTMLIWRPERSRAGNTLGAVHCKRERTVLCIVALQHEHVIAPKPAPEPLFCGKKFQAVLQ